MTLERTFNPREDPEALIDLGAFLRYALLAGMRERGLTQQEVTSRLDCATWAWPRLVAPEKVSLGELRRVFALVDTEVELEVGGDSVAEDTLLVDALGTALLEGTALRVVL